MSPILAQRQLAIASVALLGVVLSLAIAARDSRSEDAAPRLPQPAVSDVSGWYRALAGVRSGKLSGRRSACGQALSRKSLGIGHPVLPCGAKVYLSYGGRTVLTQVIDRGPYVSGREFDVTPALAELLGLTGVQRIRWSFAQAS